MLRKLNQLANEDSISRFVQWKKAAKKNRTNEKRFQIQFALNKSWILDGNGWAQSVLVLTILFFSIKRTENKLQIEINRNSFII